MDGAKRVLLGVDYSRSANDALPRLLDRAGCHTTLVCPPDILIAKTRLAARIVPCGPGKDNFLTAFANELETGTYDWVILAHDYQRDLLDRCDEAVLEGWFSVPAGDRSTHFVLAKNAFLEACRSAEIPVPTFELCASANQARRAAESIGYPVVVKLGRGYAGNTTFLARDDRVLERVLNEADLSQPFAVQHMIEGPIGSTDVLFDHGRARCRLSSYSGDCAPTPFSPKTARRIIESAALDHIVDRIGQVSRFHGLAGIDWVQDPRTGAFFVLELSPNPDGGYALTDDAEQTFADAIRAMLAGETYDRPRAVKARPEWIPVFPEWSVYFAECAERGSAARWLRFLRMLTHVSYRDPTIALRQLRSSLRRAVAR